jgi:hypothetical protein
MALAVDKFAQAAVPLPDGSWVPSKVVSTAGVIHDFFPDLEVRWLPRDKRGPNDNAFQIVEKCKDGAELVAFSVKDETEFDDRLLQRIFLADATKKKGGALDILERIDAMNDAIKAAQLKQENEAMEEARDFVKTVIASPLNKYSHNGYRFDLPEHMQPKKVIL